MDSNAMQTRQNFQQTSKKKELILEARHSISIEASNKIRSNLSPRIFMPRQPINCHTTQTQNCPKELKFKNKNLTNFNTSTNFTKDHKTLKKCQTLNSEHFFKRSRGKYTKIFKSDFKQNCQIMESEREKKLKYMNRKRNKAAEIEKQIKKQKDSKIKRKSKQSSDPKSESNKEINFGLNSKDEEAKSWCNVKIIANENPTDNARYLTDGEIIFIEETFSLNAAESLNLKEDKLINSDKDEEISKTMRDKNSKESRNKNSESSLQFIDLCSSPNLPNNENQLEYKFTSENSLETSSDLRDLSIKFGENSRKCFTQSSTKFSSKICEILQTNVNEKSEQNLNKTNSEKLGNTLPTISENFESSSKSKSKEITDKNIQNLSINSLERTLNSNETNSLTTKSYTKDTYKSHINPKETQSPVLDFKQSLQNINKRSPTLQLKATKTIIQGSIPLVITTKSPKSRKQYLTQQDLDSLDKDSLHKLPLENLINTSSTIITDFKDTVRSSLSQIYDCSLLDQKINEDLINLENCVESFSKFLLQTQNNLDELEQKTTNCMKYLYEKNMQQKVNWDLQQKSQNSSSMETDYSQESDETLTILIEAHKMPTKTITFKMSDILKPKHQFGDNGKSSMESITKIKNQMPNVSTNLKRKNLDVTIVSDIKLPNSEMLKGIESCYKSNPSSQQNTEIFSVTQKYNDSLNDEQSSPKHIRTKITGKNYNKETEIIQSQKQNINTDYEKETTIKDNKDVNTNTSNIISSTPQNSLRLHRFNKSSKSITSQTSNKYPALPTNSYNYPPASQNTQTEIFGSQHLHRFPYLPQVPNTTFNTIPNYTNTHTMYTPPNFPFNSQNQALYQSTRNSLQKHQHHNSQYQTYQQNMPPYLSNPYNRYYYYPHPLSYNSISINYAAMNFTSQENFQMENQLLQPHQKTLMDRDEQRPND